MGHLFFYLAVVAAALLWSATFVAAAARTGRPWLHRLLVAAAVIVPPLALEMIAKIRSQEESKTPGEADLIARIDQLLTELAPEITERPVSVTWRAMRERWGSCTSVDRSIRISDRLKMAPEYALNYVLFHEAIHLQYFDHGEQFTEVLSRFEESELASAYLDGFEAAERSLLAPKELDLI